MKCTTEAKRRITSKEAKDLIDRTKSFPMEIGQNWYLISQKWWNTFNQSLEVCADETFEMPPINNESIVNVTSTANNKPFYKLKEHLTESMSYTMVPEPVFTKLHEIFGVVDEKRDVITRPVVVSSVLRKEPFIEVYPLRLKIAKLTRREQVCTLEVSYADSFDQLKEKAFDLLQIPTEQRKQAEILVDKGENEFEPISEKLSPSLDAILRMDMVFYIDDGSRMLRSSARSLDELNGNPRRSYLTSGSTERYTQGLCGLQNLGNTCFMNSALQCLSNVPELTEYFLSKKVSEEINSSNVLGTGGKLAKAYQELIKEMWSGNSPSVKPYQFKLTIGHFAPRFNGYNQQDAQELMAFLLDGLHEDLNRIYEKPYVEEKESDGRADHVVAKEAWSGYKKRNDSIIVDLMHGQLKSTVNCNVCNKTSIKFDPFCFLSVPVPTKERSLQTEIVVCNEKKWKKFNVSHTNKTLVKQVTTLLKQNLNLADSQRLVLATTFGQTKHVMDEEATMPQFQYTSYSARTLVGYVVESGPVVLVENLLPTSYAKQLTYPLVLNLKNPLNADEVLQVVVPLMQQTIWRESKLRTAVTAGNLDAVYEFIKDITYEADGNSPISLFNKKQVGNENFETATSVNIKITWNDSEAFPSFTNIENGEVEDIGLTGAMKRNYTLVECIEMFTSREQLETNEAWYCPSCKTHRCAFKKLDVWKLPRILIVHLKRFLYTRYNRDKIDTEIVIPVKNFSPTDKLANPNHEPVVYDLIAISNHMGGLGSGHYTAKGFCKSNGHWCDFNDSSATVSTDLPDPLTSREAYILVYRQRNEPTPAPTTRASRRLSKPSESEQMDTSC